MIQVEYLPTASLNAAPYNPRKMPDEQMARLMHGIEAFGLVDPIIVNQSTGNIVGGHQRVEAAKRLKLAEVPVVHVTLDRDQEKALNLALNKISGEWDLDLLRGILGDLSADDFDMDLTGFSAGEVADLLAGGLAGDDPEHEPGDPDEVPEVDEQAPPVTKPGDLIVLGAHRLLCGDSTKAEDVARLMDGALADMVFTDPPYGVDYDGGHAEKGKRREKLANDGTPDIYVGTMASVREAAKPEAALYLWYAERCMTEVSVAVTSAGYEIRSNLIWNKNLAQFGAIGAQYKAKHEPCLYCFRKGTPPYWSGPTNEVTVWDVKREPRNEYHPTQKPVELAERAIGNSCPDAGGVLDLFGGSGSTLIACEQAGRRAYLMELDPRYCDVIVARWEKFTGKTAQRIERKVASGRK